MATRDLAFRLFGKDVSASKTFDKVGDKADRSGSRISAAFAKAGPALAAGVAAAGAAAVAFGASSIKAFAEAEVSQEKLSTAFNKFPQLAGANIEALRDFNSQLAKKTKYDDDATATGQAVLAQFGLTADQLKTVTPLMQDYATRTGKTLPEAAQVLGKAVMGQGKALKGIGINFKDTGSKAKNFDQLVGGLRKQVGGFAQKEAGTTAGKLAILKNQFGELQESVGAKLMPVLTKVMTFFVQTAVPALQKFGAAVAERVKPMLATLMPMLARLGEFLVTTVWPAVQRVAGILGGALASAFNTIRDRIQENRPQLERLGELFVKIAKFIYEKVYPAFATILGKAIEIAGGVIGGIITTIGFLVTAFDKIAGAARWVGDIFTTVFDGVQDAIRGVVNFVIKAINLLIRGYNRLPGFLRGDKISELALIADPDANRPSSSTANYDARDEARGGGSRTILVMDRRVVGEVVTSDQHRTAQRNRGARVAIV